MSFSRILKVSTFVLACANTASAALEYTLSTSDTYQGDSFFDKFDFHTATDPTSGFVQYVSESLAASDTFGGPLINKIDGQAYLGVDHWNTYNPQGAGRPSVRIETKKKYTHGLFIANITHMPASVCGTWPAFWTVSHDDYPRWGEVDILENIHEETVTLNTLHTGPGCSVSGLGQTGKQSSYSCADVETNGAGCAAVNSDPNSYGSTFNSVGGGILAMEWTSEGISIWNWAPNRVPKDIKDGSPDLLHASWGIPAFTSKSGACDVDSHFKEHNVVFDTTFCGNWAGQDYFWQKTSCYDPNRYPTCKSYVAANPAKYKDAYWLVDSLKVYKQTEVVKQTTTSSTSSSSTTSTTSSSSSSTSSTSSSTTSSTSTSTTSSSSSSSSSSVTSTETSSSTSASVTSTSSTSSSSASITISSSSATSNTTSSATVSPTSSGSSSVIWSNTTSSSSSITSTLTSSTVSLSSSSSDSATSTAISTSSTSLPVTPSGSVSPTSHSTTETASHTTTLSATSEMSLTTSTVYSESTYTVTSCPPSVTKCPLGSLTTETIAIYTSVCPVSEISKPTPTPSLTTSTVHTSSVYTIPGGIVTTEIISYVTVCPITSVAPTPSITVITAQPVSIPTGKATTIVVTTTKVVPPLVLSSSPATFPTSEASAPPPIAVVPTGSTVIDVVQVTHTVLPVFTPRYTYSTLSKVQNATSPAGTGKPSASGTGAVVYPTSSPIAANGAAEVKAMSGSVITLVLAVVAVAALL